jgi:hypothetical protein
MQTLTIGNLSDSWFGPFRNPQCSRDVIRRAPLAGVRIQTDLSVAGPIIRGRGSSAVV